MFGRIIYEPVYPITTRKSSSRLSFLVKFTQASLSSASTVSRTMKIDLYNIMWPPPPELVAYDRRAVGNLREALVDLKTLIKDLNDVAGIERIRSCLKTIEDVVKAEALTMTMTPDPVNRVEKEGVVVSDQLEDHCVSDDVGDAVDDSVFLSASGNEESDIEVIEESASPSSSSPRQSTDSAPEKVFSSIKIMVTGLPDLPPADLKACFPSELGVVLVQRIDARTACLFVESLSHLRAFVDANDSECLSLSNGLKSQHGIDSPPIRWRLSAISEETCPLRRVFFRVLRRGEPIEAVVETNSANSAIAEAVRRDFKDKIEGVFHAELFLPDDPTGGCVYFENEERAEAFVESKLHDFGENAVVAVWSGESTDSSVNSSSSSSLPTDSSATSVVLTNYPPKAVVSLDDSSDDEILERPKPSIKKVVDRALPDMSDDSGFPAPPSPPLYDLFDPEIQSSWRSAVEMAYHDSLQNTPEAVLRQLRRFKDFPDLLPIETRSVEMFLRNDLEETNDEVIRAMVRGLNRVKRAFERRLTSRAPVTSLNSTTRLTSFSGKPRIKKNSPVAFASRDFRLSLPSFDGHKMQRRWRDAISQTLKDSCKKLSATRILGPAVREIFQRLLDHPSSLPYRKEKIHNFLKDCLKVEGQSDIEQAVEVLVEIFSKTFNANDLVNIEASMVKKLVFEENADQTVVAREDGDNVRGAVLNAVKENQKSPENFHISKVVDLTDDILTEGEKYSNSKKKLNKEICGVDNREKNNKCLDNPNDGDASFRYNLLVDSVPDDVEVDELRRHFQAVAGATVSVKVLHETASSYTAWIKLTSRPALLRVLNAVPFPPIWPGVGLKATMDQTSCEGLFVTSVDLLDTRSRFEDRHYAALKSHFSTVYGSVDALNFYLDMSGANVLFAEEESLKRVDDVASLGTVELDERLYPYKIFFYSR